MMEFMHFQGHIKLLENSIFPKPIIAQTFFFFKLIWTGKNIVLTFIHDSWRWFHCLSSLALNTFIFLLSDFSQFRLFYLFKSHLEKRGKFC